MEEPGEAATGVGELPAVQVAPGLEEAQHAVEATGERLGCDPGCAGADPRPRAPPARPGRRRAAARVSIGSWTTGWSTEPSSPWSSGRDCRWVPAATVARDSDRAHLPLELPAVGRERSGQLDAADSARRLAEVAGADELHRGPARGEDLELHAALAPAGREDGHRARPTVRGSRRGCRRGALARGRARWRRRCAAAVRRPPAAGGTRPDRHRGSAASSRSSASCASRRSSRASSRTTSRSAWYWANDRFSRWWASSWV